MLGVKPYIVFAGNCEEAVNFYKRSLNGSLSEISRYGDAHMGTDADKDLVMHVVLTIGDTVIMASDKTPADPPVIGNNIHIALGSDDIEGTEKMFNNMAEGGTVTMPMAETFWAAKFGMLIDKYGINWMFNCEKPHGNMAA